MKRVRKNRNRKEEVARYDGSDEWFHGGMNEMHLLLTAHCGEVQLTLVDMDSPLEDGDGSVRAIWSGLDKDFAKQFAKACAIAAEQRSKR